MNVEDGLACPTLRANARHHEPIVLLGETEGTDWTRPLQPDHDMERSQYPADFGRLMKAAMGDEEEA